MSKAQSRWERKEEKGRGRYLFRKEGKGKQRPGNLGKKKRLQQILVDPIIVNRRKIVTTIPQFLYM